MSTVGYLFILAAVIIARQTAKGRAFYLTQDLSDAFLALAQGDQKALAEVFSRSGDSNVATEPVIPDGLGGAAFNALDAAKNAATTGLSAAAVELGSKAAGYGWNQAGPTRYDCSGLMYRALQKVGYKGGRFYTGNMLDQKGMMRTLNPTNNDMVLWLAGQGGVTGHVGVVTGPDEFYSARSVRSGIGYSKISTFRKVQPIYVRWVK